MRRSLLACAALMALTSATFADEEIPAPKTPVGPAPVPVESPAPVIGPYGVPGAWAVGHHGHHGPPHGPAFPYQLPPFVMDSPNDLLPPGSPYLSYADTKGRWYSPYHVLYTIPADAQREILRIKDNRYPLIKSKKDEEKPPADK